MKYYSEEGEKEYFKKDLLIKDMEKTAIINMEIPTKILYWKELIKPSRKNS